MKQTILVLIIACVGIASIISYQQAFAVTVYPGTIIENTGINPYTNYTTDVHPNFNVTSITVQNNHIFLGNLYYDLIWPSNTAKGNITGFNEDVNFTLYVTNLPPHGTMKLDILGQLKQVKLGNFFYPRGLNWNYIIGDTVTEITVGNNTNVFTSFDPSLLPPTFIQNNILCSVAHGVATITPTITWFGVPLTLNATQNQLNQNGVFVLVNATSSQFNGTTGTLHQNTSTQIDSLKIPINGVKTFYVITVVTDGINFYGIQSNTITCEDINNLPLTFFTLNYGATHTYNQTTNGLITEVRHDTSPLAYTVIVKNNTGGTVINQSYSVPQVMDQRSYNVSGVAFPASLSIFAGGNLIYSAYLGSPVSLASVAAFFHQYFNYQGFDLLSFLPIVFAAMFTRNTVGIGAVMVVVLIATLSWLSVIVVPDSFIFIMVVIAIISMIGYRLYDR